MHLYGADNNVVICPLERKCGLHAVLKTDSFTSDPKAYEPITQKVT